MPGLGPVGGTEPLGSMAAKESELTLFTWDDETCSTWETGLPSVTVTDHCRIRDTRMNTTNNRKLIDLLIVS